MWSRLRLIRIEARGAQVPPQELPALKPDEIAKLTKFLRTKFELPSLSVRKRPQKNDSAEVYIGDEFIGVIFRDEEDGELSYNFSMAILEIDLDE
jgi:Protein of unknown function (DUF3126)